MLIMCGVILILCLIIALTFGGEIGRQGVFIVVLGTVLYAGSYIGWQTMKVHLHGPPPPLLVALDQIFFVGDETAYVILRGLILSALFYLGADWLMSCAKQQRRRKNEAAEDRKIEAARPLPKSAAHAEMMDEGLFY